MPTVQQVIARGITQLGYTEHPKGSNESIYGLWYGANHQPWCATFQSWVLHHAGITNFAIESPKGFAWTVAGVNWFRSHGLWTSTSRAVPGDLIFYDWGGNGVSDHVGMLMQNGQTMRVLEGNTGNLSQQNGGQVMIRQRPHNSHALGAGRMSHFYSSVKPGPAPVPPVSWLRDNGAADHPTIQLGSKSGQSVKHLQGLLLRHGQNVVTDGDFGAFTQAAVMRVQLHYRLKPDGVVGPYTWSALHRKTS